MPRALLVFLPSLLGLLLPAGASAQGEAAPTRIACGSCLQQERPQLQPH